ncbi:MAG TPA: MOSC domain-containing protein [Marinobacter sp.]|jgi:hypothetical protein|nr:MOSC domain-containing protein [Marinobacter sp.]
MQVHSLFIYPVKSLAGIPVQQIEFDDFGPVADRRWMIVDEAGEFVTQRGLPRLALVKTRLEHGQVRVEVPGQCGLPLEMTEQQLTVGVWRDRAMAQAEAGRVSRALSDFCGRTLRLVYMPDSSFRRVDPERVQESRRVSFADGFPLLVTNTRSLKDLNRRLAEPVTMNRFRPNIVVDGNLPWEEDQWRTLAVGQGEMHLVKPCARCIMTTVDPETGEASDLREPLRTLAGFRRTDDGVIFGMNGIHTSHSTIRVGDPVTVQQPE